MKKIVNQQHLTGERALFQAKDLMIQYSTFADGESPLKESQNIELDHCLFKWKYPFWYCKNITLKNSTLFEMARAGIWYSSQIKVTDSVIEAPKNFRRTNDITLEQVMLPNAAETLWNCERITMKDVIAKGDYFAMNSKDIHIDGFKFVGNYSFDGCCNVEVRGATMLSRDAFWNCENVTVYDSFISGEYLGWNSKNLIFVNCTIESLQGMCYIENLKMVNCRFLNTTLAFEYSTVDIQTDGTIDSVMNPSSGTIRAKQIHELIIEPGKVNPKETKIILEEMKHAV